MDNISNNYDVKVPKHNKNKHPYLGAAILGGAIGATSTGVDLYLSSKGKLTCLQEELLLDSGSGLSWSRVPEIKNKTFLKFAKNKWGALALGVVDGALCFIALQAVIRGVKYLFKGKKND